MIIENALYKFITITITITINFPWQSIHLKYLWTKPHIRSKVKLMNIFVLYFQQHMKALKLSIESSAPILTLLDYNKIFHKLDELHTIHSVFYTDLEMRVSHWTDRHLIGDLFTSLVRCFLFSCYVTCKPF